MFFLSWLQDMEAGIFFGTGLSLDKHVVHGDDFAVGDEVGLHLGQFLRQLREVNGLNVGTQAGKIRLIVKSNPCFDMYAGEEFCYPGNVGFRVRRGVGVAVGVWFFPALSGRITFQFFWLGFPRY